MRKGHPQRVGCALRPKEANANIEDATGTTVSSPQAWENEKRMRVFNKLLCIFRSFG